MTKTIKCWLCREADVEFEPDSHISGHYCEACISELTCESCLGKDECPCAYDLYNIGGDCLMEK